LKGTHPIIGITAEAGAVFQVRFLEGGITDRRLENPLSTLFWQHHFTPLYKIFKLGIHKRNKYM
jgi:hypothetical protein